jgi:hypothetical protein
MMNGPTAASANPPNSPVVCGLPFQSGHNYAVGEYVTAPQSKPTLRCESMVFKVTTAGFSGTTMNGTNCSPGGAAIGTPGGPPVVGYWNCAGAPNAGNTAPATTDPPYLTIGCQVRANDGTAVFTYIGRSNVLPWVWLVKMQ